MYVCAANAAFLRDEISPAVCYFTKWKHPTKPQLLLRHSYTFRIIFLYFNEGKKGSRRTRKGGVITVPSPL